MVCLARGILQSSEVAEFGATCRKNGVEKVDTLLKDRESLRNARNEVDENGRNVCMYLVIHLCWPTLPALPGIAPALTRWIHYV